jgi:hypothetical protein
VEVLTNNYTLLTSVVDTELHRHHPILKPIMQLFGWNFFSRTPLNGAQTTLYCAVAPEAGDGKYYYNCQEATPSEHAQDEKLAEKLWKVSEELVAPYASKK